MCATRLIDVVLVVLATTRLTRLITEDHLGRWYVTGPVTAWGTRHEVGALVAAGDALDRYAVDDPDEPGDLEDYDEDHPWTWQKRLSEGITCRWCVGFWVGVLILVSDVLTRTAAFGWARPLWRFGVAALGLNVVANWVGDRTDTLP